MERFKSNQEIYHTVWKLARDLTFDRSKIRGLPKWKHRFDERIHSAEDALGFADQMLASLGDEFTHLYSSEAESHMRVYSRRQNVIATQRFGDIGYIRIEDFMSEDTDWQLQRALTRLVNFDALIIDLRDNFGGKIEVALNCCQLLLPQGSLGSVTQRQSRFQKITIAYELTDKERIVTTRSTLPLSKPKRTSEPRRLHNVLNGRRLVLLIDEGTASAAEMFAQTLQDHGATVVGMRSVGKGIGQSHISLNGIATVQITTSHYYSPRGKWLGDAQKQRLGVTPDKLVGEKQENKLAIHPTVEPLQDRQLCAALRCAGKAELAVLSPIVD